MFVKVFLGAIFVGWGLAAVLLSVFAIQKNGQAAQYQQVMVTAKIACQAGRVDACN